MWVERSFTPTRPVSTCSATRSRSRACRSRRSSPRRPRAGRRDRATPHPGPDHGRDLRGGGPAGRRHDLRRGGPGQPDHFRRQAGIPGGPARHRPPQAHGGRAARLRGTVPASLRAQPRRRFPFDRGRADARVQPRLREHDGLRVAGGGPRPAGRCVSRRRPRARGLPREPAARGESPEPREEAAPKGRQPHLGDRERFVAAHGGRERGDHPRHPLRHDGAAPARGAAPAIPEDGGGGAPGGRHRARFQQSPDRGRRATPSC